MKMKKYIGIVKNYHGCMSGCRIELLSKFYDDHATFHGLIFIQRVNILF